SVQSRDFLHSCAFIIFIGGENARNFFKAIQWALNRKV
ncbi:hypothetical protein BMETH_33411332482027, partial [methanotrophic bacterial endosymbiont of Bathymodiolus sp.]